jgi:hypothetical protein
MGHESNYDPALYPVFMVQARMYAVMLQRLPLAEMHAQAERADAVGAIFHPTEYREKMDGLAMDKDILEALAVAKRKCKEAVDRFNRHRPPEKRVSLTPDDEPLGVR